MEGMILGLANVIQWQGLIALLAGLAVGIFLGAVPGVSTSTALILILPFTFTISPVLAIVLTCALYMGAEYGGSISAITVGVPGTAGAIATAEDGRPLALQGKAGKALMVSLIASTVGGVLGTLSLIFLLGPLTEAALRFGPPELFSLAIFGVTAVASMGGGSYVKAFIALGIGLFLALVGLDPISGSIRFTGEITEMEEGIPLVPALLGLFAISEVLMMAEARGKVSERVKSTLRNMWPNWSELSRIKWAVLKGSIIGIVIGLLPGTGASTAALLSYDQQRRWSKTPEKYGSGMIEGVAAPEAANNATVGGALVPMFALGIPGSASAAILLAMLSIQGLVPGPQMFNNQPEIPYTAMSTLLLGSLLMFPLGFGLTILLWSRIARMSPAILGPVIFGICYVGALANEGRLVHAWILMGCGVLGYVLRRYGFPLAPIILGLVLGDLIEYNLRISLVISHGSYGIFFSRPLSAAVLSLSIVTFFMPIVMDLRKRKFAGRAIGAKG